MIDIVDGGRWIDGGIIETELEGVWTEKEGRQSKENWMGDRESWR
jgi:hypothetical protein